MVHSYVLSRIKLGEFRFDRAEFYLPMTAAIFRNCPNIQLCGGLAPASLENKVYNEFLLLV